MTHERLLTESDGISRAHDSGNNYRGIESAQAPSGRGWIAGLGESVEDGRVDFRAVDIQRRARAAALGDFDNHVRADAPALSRAPLAAGNAAGREVLAHRAGGDGKAQRGELLNALGGNQQEGTERAAVN